MQNRFSQLGRAFLIHAAMVRFPLDTYDIAAAYRAVLRHHEMACATGMLAVVNYACDLGDDIAPTLDLHPIADLHAQPLDLIHVVERGPAYGGSADGHRLEFRDWRELSSSANLHANVFDLRDAPARSIFV